MTRLAAIALPWLLLAGVAPPAAAQDHPPYVPTRDAVVEYRLLGVGGAGPRTMTMYFQAGGNLVRMEPAGQPVYMLMDKAGKRMMIVMNEQRMVMQMPVDPAQGRAGFTMDPSMKFTRGGSDTVAGQRCINWDIVGDAFKASSCITEDGVMLRGRGFAAGPATGGGPATPGDEHERGIEAISVAYGTIPPDKFVPPADFQTMDPSHLPNGARPRPGQPPR